MIEQTRKQCMAGIGRWHRCRDSASVQVGEHMYCAYHAPQYAERAGIVAPERSER